MERDPIYIHLACLPLHFNSHAHVERDVTLIFEISAKSISTHTLTWSVTFCRFCYLLYLNYFNSHAHVERDISADVNIVNIFISTHTLTWSVTIMYIKIFQWQYFNSHAHVERDHGRTCQTPLMSISTHTLTWSVTVFDGKEWNTEKNFNSHAHVERDSYTQLLTTQH